MVALAVHGVSNRSEDAFARTVAALSVAAGRGPDGIVPVFWGDLGPDGPLASVPGAADASVLPVPPAPAAAFAAAPAAPGAGPEEEALARAAATGDAVIAALAGRDALTPEAEEAVRTATTEAAAAGWSLALHPSVAPLVADAVIARERTAVGAFSFDPRRAITGVLRRIQDAVTDILVREMREREAGLGGTIARSLGDVLVYDGLGPQIRGRLDTAYRAARAGGRPVDLVAHSLGALVAVEWLLGAPAEPVDGVATPPAERTIRHLVTFGTQVSLFAELQGLVGPDGTHAPGPGPRALPLAIASWTNVWQELDPLAFVMGRVLRVEGPTGPVPVVDHRLTQEGIPTDLGFHSSYWTDPRFARWLGPHLGG
ncbi:MAG TPA: hypothetical protein VFU19_05730 [Iamia sp.]|nr:hypothetical protein [Iamia sp.]